jgi:hypothetical protein
MHLLISDANVLIDIEEGELISPLFRLPHRIATPDILFFDELESHHPGLPGAGLELLPMPGDLIDKAQRLAAQHPAPSRYDMLALVLAQEHQCALLTGDNPLRKLATEKGVEVHGTLWIVEQMVRERLLTKDQAQTAYERMQWAGSRLPWETAFRRLEGL